jgi:hypothetical protein
LEVLLRRGDQRSDLLVIAGNIRNRIATHDRLEKSLNTARSYGRDACTSLSKDHISASFG